MSTAETTPPSDSDTVASLTIGDGDVRERIRKLFHDLDAYRAEIGISKAELARRASLNPSHLRRLLSKGGNPRLSTLVKICVALDLELSFSAHAAATQPESA